MGSEQDPTEPQLLHGWLCGGGADHALQGEVARAWKNSGGVPEAAVARSGEESVCLKVSPAFRELGGWQVAPAVVAREGGSALGVAASGARRNPKCCLAGFLWVVWRALCKVKWQERGKTAAACRRQPWQIAAEEQHLPQSVAWRLCGSAAAASPAQLPSRPQWPAR